MEIFQKLLIYPILAENSRLFIVYKIGAQEAIGKGFSALKQIVAALKDNKNIIFLGIQTVFEGHDKLPNGRNTLVYINKSK